MLEKEGLKRYKYGMHGSPLLPMKIPMCILYYYYNIVL